MRLEGTHLPGMSPVEQSHYRGLGDRDPAAFQKQLDNILDQNKEVENVQTPEGDETPGEDKELLNAARQFEAMFIQEMLKGMRATVPESDFLHGGFAEDVYEGMLDQEYADQMAETGGFGLADKIYDQLTSEYAGIRNDRAIPSGEEGPSDDR